MRPLVISLLVLLAAGCSAGGRDAAPQWQEVTQQRLTDADKDDGWLMYLRSYSAHGHAPFDEINTGNVAKLHVVFTHRVTVPEGYEAPPIVNGRTMIVTTPMDHVYALDAVTGKMLWQYVHDMPHVTIRTVCCDVVNRGVALLGNNVYMGTLDNHVIALDARDGHVVWDRQLNRPGVGFAISQAPLAVHGTVITGDGGGEYGGRGAIFGLDAATGREKWRFYTVPSPREPGGNTWPGNTYEHGGANPWMTGSYDTETNTLFMGTGNPSPWLWSERKGQNLYADSIVALNPDTGKLKWYFQQTPNDPWDYDSTATPVMADVTIDGRPRKVLYQAARNGWFYVIDRTNGSLILTQPFTTAMSVKGYDRVRRIGLVDDTKKPRVGQKIFTCPAFFGGDNWWSFSFDPKTHYAFVPTMRTCMTLSGEKPAGYKPGAGYLDEGFQVEHVPGLKTWGALQAIDVTTGKRVWSKETLYPWTDGTLSTDGGLVFSGTPDQKFYAFDAKSGKVLWQFHTHSGIVGQPVSYRVDGKQYIAVQSGYGGVAPYWGGPKMTPLFRKIPLGGTLYVFSL